MLRIYSTMQLDLIPKIKHTHSLQQPNQSSGVTRGLPDMIATIAKADITLGVDSIFIETHFDLVNAKSDVANILDLKHLEKLLIDLTTLREIVNTL